MKKTKLISAWCGTGKTYICEKTDILSIEVEYWKYKDPKKYIKDIRKYLGKVDYIFISTDPKGLKLLDEIGFEIDLIYPKNELRDEYLQRYLDRDSPADFIGVFMKYWDNWLNELKGLSFCSHTVLDSGQFLQTALDKL